MKRLALLFALWLIPALAPPAGAQGTGRSMDFDLSIRSAAMGGASNAMSWGDLNYWGNPALLGYAQGVRYVHTHTQLVPGLANDVFLNSNVVEVGGGGLGVVFSGKPAGGGGVRLDYGQSEGRDENGNPTGTYDSWETVKSIGAGISVARALESALRFGAGRDIDLSRYADVSFGANAKAVTIVLGPANALGSGPDRTEARDWGIQARVTPYDGFRAKSSPPIRVDLAHGVSVLSYNDDAIVSFTSVGESSPVTRHHRRGSAGRIAAGRWFWEPSPNRGALLRALVEGLTPLLTVSAAADHADIGTLHEINYRTNGSGTEVTIVNVFTYRRGHYEDLTGQIDGDTWGWGVALPLGSLGGARYDDAHIPQARNSGLQNVHRSQVTVWLDPIAIWRLSHGERRELISLRP